MMATLNLWALPKPASRCTEDLKIPVVEASQLADVKPGSAYMNRLAQIHASVGPIFRLGLLPWWLNSSRPLFFLASKLPGGLGRNLKPIYRQLKVAANGLVQITGPSLLSSFSRNPKSVARIYDIMGLGRTLGKSGLLMLADDDPLWAKTHAEIAPFLTNRHARAEYLTVIEKVLFDLLPHFLDDEHEIPVRDFSDRLSASLMHRILLGFDLEDAVFASLDQVAGAAWAGASGENSQKSRFRQIFGEHVQKSASYITPDSIAGQLKKSALGFPEDWWMDQLTTLYFAGQETTRALFAFALFEMAGHPAMQSRFRAPAAGDSFRENFLKEVTRLHTTVGAIPRLTQAEFLVGSYVVHAETLLNLNIENTHLSPEYFSDPQTFDPDRYSRDSIPPTGVCPFGFGKRICIGQNLAKVEAEFMLSTLLERYSMVLESEASSETPELPRGGPTSVPAGMRILLEPVE